jgi:hypothetical protein
MERKVISGIIVALLLVGILPLSFKIQPIKATYSSNLVYFDDFSNNSLPGWVAGGYLGNNWTTMPSVSGGKLTDSTHGQYTTGSAMHRNISLGLAFRINMSALAALVGLGSSKVGVTVYSNYSKGLADGYMFVLDSGSATHSILKIRNGVVVGTILTCFFGDQANDAGPWRFERDADGYWSMYSNRIYTSGGFDMEYTNFDALDVFILDSTGYPAFIHDIYVYELVPLAEYNLTIVTTVGGTTNPTSGIYTYANGTTASITANPYIGYTLDHWELDGSNVGSANPYTVTMNQNHTLKAMFIYSPPLSTTHTYVFSRTASYTWSQNWSNTWGPVMGPNTVPFSDRYNITFSEPDANGVINLTVPVTSYYCAPAYDSVGGVSGPFTWQLSMTSDGYGKLYTLNGTGDVDIKSMTNDAGTFFWKDGIWHPAGEEWIGDGTLDPAGSSWLCLPLIVSSYEGNGTGGLLLGQFRMDFWYTTGFIENTVVKPASPLNGFYMNETGVPFNGTSGIMTYVEANAILNIPWVGGSRLDLQHEAVRSGAPSPALFVTLFSPANLYVTDPENRHIGTNPITGKAVNEIPKAFYSGPGSEPQRIVIADPLNGVYDIRLIGTGTGTYNLVAELATNEKTTTRTYTSNVSAGQVLESRATISGGEMASTSPSSPTPVGGIYITVNKLELLAPYIGLTILLAVALATVAYVKKRKRHTEIIC